MYMYVDDGDALGHEGVGDGVLVELVVGRATDGAWRPTTKEQRQTKP